MNHIRANYPIDNLFDIQEDEGGLPLKAAVMQIAQIHGDGKRPSIPMYRAVALPLDDAGYHLEIDGVYRYESRVGSPHDIVISTGGRFPEISTIHEVGHYLDNQCLDFPGRYASENSSLLESWRRAVLGSNAVKILNSRRRVSSVKVLTESGYVNFRLSANVIDYALRLRELFARSYVQYIVLASQDPTLAAQFEEISQRIFNRVYAIQWEEEDFSGIAASITQLFLDRGWLI